MFLRIDKLHAELPAPRRADPSATAAITAEEFGRVELFSNGAATLNSGPDNDGDETAGGDISDAPFADMKGIRHRRLCIVSPGQPQGLQGNRRHPGQNGETALPGEPEVVEGRPDGGGAPSAQRHPFGLHAGLRARGDDGNRSQADQSRPPGGGVALKSPRFPTQD